MLDDLWKDAHAFLTVPTILLTSLLLLGAWVLKKAQQNPSFEISHMLVDERGKPSGSRLAVFVALGTSTYMLVYVVSNHRIDDQYLFYFYLAYLLTWASSKGLEKFAAALGSRLSGAGSGQITDHPGVYLEPTVIYSERFPVTEKPTQYRPQNPIAVPRFTIRQD
jgi:hypothetical protein